MEQLLNLKDLESILKISRKNQDNLNVLLDMVQDMIKILNVYKDVPCYNDLVVELSIKISKCMKQLQE